MSDADNWRDSSNWRTTRDSGPPPAKNPRPFQGRLAAPSWRTKDASNPDDDNATASRREKSQQQGSWTPGTRPSDRERTMASERLSSSHRDSRDRGRDKDSSAATTRAIAEGRRIYMGNLRYQAKPSDIEGLLEEHGLGDFESIHISIDHFTGRNPSYCFVEFQDRESADRAMETLEGKLLLGREVKCRPCIPKGGASGGRRSEGLDRWGRWSGERNGEDREEQPSAGQDPETEDSPSSLTRYTKDFTGQRLYVGGLPRMHDQATNFTEINELFKDFQVEAISKRITAHESARTKPGHHDFCFVDFATPEQAKTAIEAVNGRHFRGGRLKVSLAGGRSNKWQERENLQNASADMSVKQID